MLASLLPGLRELRTPLVVGWTWLVAFWVLLADYLRMTSGIPLIGEVVRVSGLLGQTAVVAVLTFTAYLLGSLVVRENDWTHSSEPHNLAGSRRLSAYIWRGGGPQRASAIGRELSDFVQARAEEFELRLKAASHPGSVFDPIRPYLSNVLELQTPADIKAIRQQGLAMDLLHSVVSAQRIQLETRLLAEKREVYDYYDRLKESANLRGSLAPAVMGLGIAAGIRLFLNSQPYWASILSVIVGLIIAYTLVIKGRRQFERSTEALTTAVVTGLIASPMIEYWDSQVSRIESRR